jgi:hypothetical protein
MAEITEEKWDLHHLCLHLQMAAFLEAWTIPYYMAAMFSIVDRATDAYQLIQSVLHQEMLHLQLAANVANAYGCSPHIEAEWFSYGRGEKIPFLHYEFSPHAALVAVSDATPDDYKPRSAEIGRLDEHRINTMCLIEFPHWSAGSKPAYRDDLTDYDSIGQFYDAVEHGAKQLGPTPIVGGRRQVDMFSAFYRRLPRVTVDSSGDEGLAQVLLLLDVIRDQGEAAKADDPIHRPHENTADDPHPTSSHYDKFRKILAQPLPATYATKEPADYTAADQKYEQILIDNFKEFIDALNGLFAGNNPDGFVPLMVTIGANILNCWKNNVTPKFTDTQHFASFGLQQRNFYAL